MNTSTITEHNEPMVLFPEIIPIIIRLFEIQNQRKATVFCELVGHVQSFRVRVFKGSWESDAAPDFDQDIYIDQARRAEVKMFKDTLYQFLATL